ncbi:terminase large subunit [Arcobacter sp.]|uniref:terminase large subunit n=1 Tax=unclassified Arcobacter TaxID=2593671 RepID=UPI003AFFA234
MIFDGEELKPYYEKTFERHQKDLLAVENGEKPHLRFNKKLGIAYIKIIEQLNHYKGEFAGQNIKLEAWQKKAIVIAFGWERLNDKNRWVRRFNTVFFFIPRKNGKTLLASAITIADSIIRFEIGGEVIIFATKNKQAKLAWTGVEKMVNAHKDLKEDCMTSYGVITMKKTDTTFSTLGRDSDTEDGSNPTIGVADEYHAHPDNSLFEVVESGQGSRIQPLMLSITTGGFKLMSPAFNMYEYGKKILDGAIEDDTFFAFIAEPDKDDDPFEEKTWIKANPNYGVSVSKDYMQRQAKRAYERPETKNNFLVKNLNIWTNAAESYIPIHEWKECEGKLADETNIKKVQGFDLSVTDDFTAKAKIYKIDDIYYLKMNYYIPKDNVLERERTLKVPLLSWVNQGYITATPGSTIDYDYIYNDIEEDIPDTNAVVYDAYKAKHLVKRIVDNGFEDCIPLRQGYISLTSPTKFLLDLVKSKKLIHNGDPVTTWMISNLTILFDAAGNIKPDKTDPNRKIDGPAAIINALSYYEATEENKESVYETRGLRSL